MAQIETIVEPVRVAVLSLDRTVLLKQKGANNYLPFWTNASQAKVIAAQLYGSPNKDVELDLFLANNNAADADIKGIIVHLEGASFYATILLCQHSRSYEIECPIGIAIALACRAHAAILVDEEVFTKAGMCLPPTPCEPQRKQFWWRRLFKSSKRDIAGCSLTVAGYDGTNVVYHFVDDLKNPRLQAC